jgi:DNA repair protein RadA/Sms
MAKAHTQFTCQTCGYQSARWMGRCPDCGQWGGLVEERVSPGKRGGTLAGPSVGSSRPTPITAVDAGARHRIGTGLAELDRVLGGGIVPGSFIVLGGPPGIGKSTLLLQASSWIANEGGPVLYATAEESLEQVRARGDRLGSLCDRLLLLSETSLQPMLEHAERLRPRFLVIDSIQTMASDDLGSPPGTISQVRELAVRLMGFAKMTGVSIMAVGHITKDGSIAGPKALEHLVDAVVLMEGEEHQLHRLLRTTKNRFGPCPEVGVLEMGETGLREFANPSAVLLAQRPAGASGSVVIPTLEGSRPLLVELQALVAAPTAPTPRRVMNGVDGQRGAFLLAVLEKRLGLPLSARDVYVNVVGGVSVSEPAADVGLVTAVLSSARDIALDPHLTAFGEIGLAGEVRAVPMADLRLYEAARLGLTRCLLPCHNLDRLQGAPASLHVAGLRSVDDLVRQLEVLQRASRFDSEGDV